MSDKIDAELSQYETLTGLVGREGILETPEGLGVRVTILEAKVTYGRLRVRVSPVAGSGEAWVYRTRVSLGTTP